MATAFALGITIVKGQDYTFEGTTWTAEKNQKAAKSAPKANTFWQLKEGSTDTPTEDPRIAQLEQKVDLLSEQLKTKAEAEAQFNAVVELLGIVEGDKADDAIAELQNTIKAQAQELDAVGKELASLKKKDKPEITGFKLIDYTVSPPALIKTLIEGEALPADLPAKLRVQAVTMPEVVGPVAIAYNGTTITEQNDPYELPDFAATVGAHTVKATIKANGFSKEITFTVKAKDSKKKVPRVLFFEDSFATNAAKQYAKENLNATLNMRIFSIKNDGDGLSAAAVKRFLDKHWPVTATRPKEYYRDGCLFNWEGQHLKRFKSKDKAIWGPREALYSKLFDMALAERPNMIFTPYAVPVCANYTSQDDWNEPIQKFDRILSKAGLITTNLYFAYATEEGKQLFGSKKGATKQETGWNGWVAYMEHNLKYLIELGERYKKPVCPMIFPRLHFVNTAGHKNKLIQPELYAKVFEYCMTYQHPTLKRGVDYVMEWESQVNRTNHAGGLPDLKTGKPWIGTTPTAADYDKMKVTRYYPLWKQVLNTL